MSFIKINILYSLSFILHISKSLKIWLIVGFLNYGGFTSFYSVGFIGLYSGKLFIPDILTDGYIGSTLLSSPWRILSKLSNYRGFYFLELLWTVDGV